MAIRANGRRTGTNRTLDKVFRGKKVPRLPIGMEAYNPRQMKFMLLALKNGGNYAEAYREAYDYEGRAASKLAQRLLNKPGIREILASMAERAFRAAGVEAAQILGETHRIAFANPKDYFDKEGRLIPVHLLPDEVAAAIKQMDIEIKAGPKGEVHSAATVKLHDKLKALHLLGSNQGVFKSDGTSDVNVHLVIDRMEAGRRRALEARAARARPVQVTEVSDATQEG